MLHNTVADECIAILLLMLRNCCFVPSLCAACYLQSMLRHVWKQQGFQILNLTWDDPDFHVLMDSISGPHAPSGDLRFVVKALTGKLQVVVVQCKKVGAGEEQGCDCTASIHDIQHHLTQLRACFDR